MGEGIFLRLALTHPLRLSNGFNMYDTNRPRMFNIVYSLQCVMILKCFFKILTKALSHNMATVYVGLMSFLASQDAQKVNQ